MSLVRAEEPVANVTSMLDRNMKSILEEGVGKNFTTNVSEDTLYETIGKMVNVVLSLVGILLIILIVYGGFLWMGAQGNEEQVAKAKGYIKNAIIGIIITLMAYSISYFVLSKLSGAILSV